MRKKKTVTKQKEIQVKVFFNAEEHKILRIAAAIEGVTMRDFIKAIVIRDSEKLVKNMQQKLEREKTT